MKGKFYGAYGAYGFVVYSDYYRYEKNGHYLGPYRRCKRFDNEIEALHYAIGNFNALTNSTAGTNMYQGCNEIVFKKHMKNYPKSFIYFN